MNTILSEGSWEISEKEGYVTTEAEIGVTKPTRQGMLAATRSWKRL